MKTTPNNLDNLDFTIEENIPRDTDNGQNSSRSIFTWMRKKFMYVVESPFVMSKFIYKAVKERIFPSETVVNTTDLQKVKEAVEKEWATITKYDSYLTMSQEVALNMGFRDTSTPELQQDSTLILKLQEYRLLFLLEKRHELASSELDNYSTEKERILYEYDTHIDQLQMETIPTIIDTCKAQATLRRLGKDSSEDVIRSQTNTIDEMYKANSSLSGQLKVVTNRVERMEKKINDELGPLVDDLDYLRKMLNVLHAEFQSFSSILLNMVGEENQTSMERLKESTKQLDLITQDQAVRLKKMSNRTEDLSIDVRAMAFKSRFEADRKQLYYNKSVVTLDRVKVQLRDIVTNLEMMFLRQDDHFLQIQDNLTAWGRLTNKYEKAHKIVVRADREYMNVVEAINREEREFKLASQIYWGPSPFPSKYSCTCITNLERNHIGSRTYQNMQKGHSYRLRQLENLKTEVGAKCIESEVELLTIKDKMSFYHQTNKELTIQIKESLSDILEGLSLADANLKEVDLAHLPKQFPTNWSPGEQVYLIKSKKREFITKPDTPVKRRLGDDIAENERLSNIASASTTTTRNLSKDMPEVAPSLQPITTRSPENTTPTDASITESLVD